MPSGAPASFQLIVVDVLMAEHSVKAAEKLEASENNKDKKL